MCTALYSAQYSISPSTLGLTILTWSAPAAERSLKLYTCMPCTKCIGRGRVDSQALQQPQPRATRPALARRPRRESHFSATVGLQLGLRHMHRMALICAGDSPQPPNHCFPALGCPEPPPHRRSLGTATQERERRQPQQHWRRWQARHREGRRRWGRRRGAPRGLLRQ